MSSLLQKLIIPQRRSFLSFALLTLTYAFSSLALADSCMVNVPSCPLYNSLAGYHPDNYLNAGSDQNQCMSRAAGYYYYCGGPARLGGTAVSAEFLSGGEVLQKTFVGSSCQVRVPSCPSHPELVGTHVDNYLGASMDPVKCMARANGYYYWCGGKEKMGNESVSTAFYTNGKSVSKTTTGGPAVKRIQFPGIGAFGIFDPSIAADDSSRIWMSYTAIDPSTKWSVAPHNNREVQATRIAYSDNQGANWTDIGNPINSAQDVTLGSPFPTPAGTWVNEVSQLVYDPNALPGQRYKLIWHHYLLIHVNHGFREFSLGWIAMKMADSPMDLASAPEIKLFSGFGYNRAANQSGSPVYSPVTEAPRIALDSSYSQELAGCVFSEPGLYADSSALYMSLFCSKPTLGNNVSRLVLMKCPSPCDVSSKSSWSYAGTLFTQADAHARGFDGSLSAPSIFSGNDGQVYLSVTPTHSKDELGSDFYKGCLVFKFTDLAKGKINSLNPVAEINGSKGTATGEFSGACAHHAKSNKTGLIYSQINFSAVDKFQIFSSGANF